MNNLTPDPAAPEHELPSERKKVQAIGDFTNKIQKPGCRSPRSPRPYPTCPSLRRIGTRPAAARAELRIRIRPRSLLGLGSLLAACVMVWVMVHLPTADRSEHGSRTTSSEKTSPGPSPAGRIRLDTVTVVPSQVTEETPAAPVPRAAVALTTGPIHAPAAGVTSAGQTTPVSSIVEVARTTAVSDPPVASVHSPPAPAVSRGIVGGPEPVAALADEVAPPTRAAATLPDTDAIRQTLERYEHAFESLDVQSAARVWPSVDRRALGRAFGYMKSQRVSFERCDIRVQRDSAVAQCRGVVQIVPTVGRPTPVTSAQEWVFLLGRRDADWTIERVTAQLSSHRAAADASMH